MSAAARIQRGLAFVRGQGPSRVVSAACLQQQNGVDCGPLTVYHAWQLAAHFAAADDSAVVPVPTLSLAADPSMAARSQRHKLALFVATLATQ